MPIHPRFQNIMQVTGFEPAFSAPATVTCFVDKPDYTCVYIQYRPVVKMQDFQSRVSPFHLIRKILMVGVEPTLSIIGTTFALRASYRIRTDPYCLEGSRAKPLTLMMHTICLGPQRVELCVSAYKTDAQRPSSTSPMFHSTQNPYRTSYSAGFFSLMKLSGYCELPLIDLLWDTGFIIL